MDFSRLLEILKENDFFKIKKKRNYEPGGCHLSIRTSSLRKCGWEIINTFIRSLIWFIKYESFHFNIKGEERINWLLSIERDWEEVMRGGHKMNYPICRAELSGEGGVTGWVTRHHVVQQHTGISMGPNLYSTDTILTSHHPAGSEPISSRCVWRPSFRSLNLRLWVVTRCLTSLMHIEHWGWTRTVRSVKLCRDIVLIYFIIKVSREF